MENLYALIMAGGGGTRLWPESRAALPKQFIRLFKERSLIQIAFDRVVPLIPPERVLIVTGARYADLIHKQLPSLPQQNIIAEPAGRNTAPAVGLGAVYLRRRDPEAVMAVLTADHIMHREDTFRAALAAAGEAAQTPGRAVTLGITPAGPETGYGYIERGEPLGSIQGPTFFHVSSFREKPDRPTAEEFVRSGRFFWNSGMFVWRVDTVLREIERQLPALYTALVEIEAALDTAGRERITNRVWDGITPISIDYGVMEGARDVVVLPVDPSWNDVGSWSAVHDEGQAQMLADENHNVVQAGELVALDTQGCLIRSGKLVATVGLRDLVVIDTEDALLICPRDRAQETREVVSRLRQAGRDDLL